ncbi:MAG: methyltransferase domain-containing protein, partial [Bdellovibrionales bacterium]|nr:methyltransferase domain-containing protein [Bdellovibrionales bacterium]
MSVDGNEPDSAETTQEHAECIARKPLLRAFYDQCYDRIRSEVSSLPPGQILELGSGPGYLKTILPDLITSDVIALPGIDRVVSALDLPFADDSLSAIVMMNVFHHLQDVEAFLSEAERTLRTGGKIVMIEPANTLWGRFIYRNFHHEPFEPAAESWKLNGGGRLSDANGALPWIVFKRDYARFRERFPGLDLDQIQP